MTPDEQYGTHTEAIQYVVDRLGKDISFVELGAGNYSTPMLHDLITGSLITVETDKTWMEKFTHMENDIHKFLFTEQANWKEGISKLTGDVCFIDSYDGPSRVVAMETLKDNFSFFIVHDMENVFVNPIACYEGQERAVWSFTFCKQFTKARIITVVLSNVCNIEEVSI